VLFVCLVIFEKLEAFEESQKYKENKFIIEKAKMFKENAPL